MTIESINDVATVREEPREILKNSRIRYRHYCRCRHDYPEEFEIGFDVSTLIFSNALSYDEIRKYDGIIRKFAAAKYLDSPGQAGRMDEIKKRFGKDGELVALDIFAKLHDTSMRKINAEKKRKQSAGASVS